MAEPTLVRAKPGVTIYTGGTPHAWAPGSVVPIPSAHADQHVASGHVELAAPEMPTPMPTAEPEAA